VVNGTRGPFPNQIGTDAYYENMGNSHYNGLELTLKRTAGPLSLLASYTYSKSYDQTSSIQEQVDPYDYHRLDGISAFDLKHNFVVSYNYDLPVARLWRPNRLASGWALSGITRFATGVLVTFASFGDNYLVQVQNNGVNATSIDMPNYDGTGYKINRDPRSGKPFFNNLAFTPNALGTQGNSKRRDFYGPGIDNFDMALHKVTNLTEARSLELRLEMFNVFTDMVLRPLAYRLHPVLPVMLHSIHGDQNDTNEQTHIRAEITTAGRNNEAIEQVVMRLSIEDDVSTLSWSIIESAME